MDSATITFLIAVIGCIIGIFGFLRNAGKDVGDSASDMTRVETKLDFISEDVKDIKAESRALRGEIMEAKQKAVEAFVAASEAKASAQAAHDRLDGLGAPSVRGSSNINQEVPK